MSFELPPQPPPLPLPLLDLLTSGIKIIRGRASSLRCITTLIFLTTVYESRSPTDKDALNFVRAILLYHVLDKGVSQEDKNPYALLLKKTGLDNEFHSTTQLSLCVTSFGGPNKDLYFKLVMYAAECITNTFCPIASSSRKNANDAATLTFVLTHWSHFFKSYFSANMPLGELWNISEHMSAFTSEHERLCKDHPGVFLYMCDVMKEKHDGCVGEEKKNAWKLYENTMFTCIRLGCMNEEEEGGSNEEEGGSDEEEV
jgi:hypothetical protein